MPSAAVYAAVCALELVAAKQEETKKHDVITSFRRHQPSASHADGWTTRIYTGAAQEINSRVVIDRNERI